jgi:hypothetical protein
MHYTKSLLIIFFTFFILIVNAQQPAGTGPLFVHSNAPVEFNKITAADIKGAVLATIQSSDEKIKKIKYR